MKPFSLSSDARDAGRRDFLAWMLAVPALAGCTVAAQEQESAPDTGAAPAGGSDAANDGHDGDDGDVAMTEEQWRSCSATTRDAEGPYFAPGAPLRTLAIADASEPGVRLRVEGRLYGPDCRTPLKGYVIDLWQADAQGNYYDGPDSAFRLRGKVVTDSLGRYRVETIMPARYGDAAGIRPAHIHAKVLTPQRNSLLTTQLYFAGDPYLGQADYCTRSRTCNSGDPKRALKLVDAIVSGKAGKRATFDAFLSRT